MWESILQKGGDMSRSSQPILLPPSTGAVAQWQVKAQVAREARRAAAELRRGRPTSFVAAVGMGTA